MQFPEFGAPVAARRYIGRALKQSHGKVKIRRRFASAACVVGLNVPYMFYFGWAGERDLDRIGIAGRGAFDHWLRTGFLPSLRSADGIEVKFNPWHDPETGRFTFRGMGVHHGDGGADSAGMMDERPRRRPVRWGGGGFTGGGGGGFGGAGSTATGDWPAPPRQARGRQATVPQRPLPMGPVGRSSRPSAPPETFREVTRNGYLYRIDESGRTRHVSGTLTLANAPRSRRAQAAAGGADRRPDDDGGHYIARRFNGPTDAFNYFAQNANFNRGRYRAVEDEWASQKKAGHSVIVRIAPAFSEGSHRPDIINIWWSVDGKPRSARIPNEKQEKHGGR